MTLPNPTFHKQRSSSSRSSSGSSSGSGGASTSEHELDDHREHNDDRSASPAEQQQQQERLATSSVVSRSGRPVAGPSFPSSWSRDSKSSRKASQQQRQASRDSLGSAGRHSLVQQAAALRNISMARKSLAGQQSAGPRAQSQTTATATATATAQKPGSRGGSRKGSIAQVSISSVKRLSHRLSIKRRAHRTESFATEWARRPSGLSKQQSLLSSTTGASSSHAALEDPLRLGQQILDAYLEQQRQRELEEREQKRRDAEKRAAELAAATPTNQNSSSSGDPQQQQQQQARQPIVKVSLSSSTRKSFKDFKHISRRIFMRHSSSNKMVQQAAKSPLALSAGSSCSSASSVNLGSASSPGAGHQQQPQPHQQRQQVQHQASSPPKRRNVLKIKRSETVLETRSGSSPSSRLSHQLSANILGK